MIFQVIDADVAPQLDVAEEAKARVGGDAVERGGDGLDLLVVGRHAVAHQSERRRQPVVQIDLDDQFTFLEEALGGIEPGRPGADNGDAQGLRGRS